ncbi:MAG: type II toxin-antitoxin system HicA family toxin [Bacteroidota bacterium]|jgi:predicted RNA binding protein YcfA (HicA-like mRNA interferase family)
MSKLPVVSGKEAVKAFCRIGYRVVRQKGSDMRLRDDLHEFHQPLTIPNHKTLKPGLLRKLIHQAGITMEDFNQLLK